MEFCRQEYWNGLPCPLPGDLPDSGIEPTVLMFPALAGGFFTTNASWEAPLVNLCACVLANQLCLTLCDLMDCSPPGSSVLGIFQAKVLEWGAIAFSVSCD